MFNYCFSTLYLKIGFMCLQFFDVFSIIKQIKIIKEKMFLLIADVPHQHAFSRIYHFICLNKQEQVSVEIKKDPSLV